jgi:hypothetical protein
LPAKDVFEVPVFVHSPNDEYIDAPISFEALDEVLQWAKIWSRSCDSNIVKRASNVVKSVESFLEALDHSCKEKKADSGGNLYLSGLLDQAEALLASVPKARRKGNSR